MTATIIDLNTERAHRRAEIERQEEQRLRQEVLGFSESLQSAIERFGLNLPMMATLLMAKAVEALEHDQPIARSEAAEFESASSILKAILKARSAARAKAESDAVRILNMANGA